MTRRFARELALQALFSVELGHHGAADVLETTLARKDLDDHRSFVSDLVFGTIEHASDADTILAPLLEGWTLERLSTVDRLLLRMGLYEMRFRTDTPRAVVINEAVELAKKFSTEESGRFVNGVLSSAARLP